MYSGNGGYGGGRGGGGYGGGGGGQKKAKALYDFYGEGPNDLTFKKGDVITVTSENATSGPEWWVGELRGKRGEFPHNHVQVESGGGGGGNHGGDTDHYGIPYGNPGPSIPMNTLSSPSSSRFGGGSSYGGSSSTALNTPEEKPAKPEKPAKSPRFGGGGGGLEGGTMAKVAFSFAIIAFVFLLLGLIFPWYRTTYEEGNWTRLWSWSGVSEYKAYAAGAMTPPTTNKVVLRTFKGLRLPTLRGVALTSIIFIVPSLLGIAVQIVMFFMMMKDNLEGTKKILIVSSVTFGLFFIGWAQYFRFGAAWKKDIEPGCTSVGPCHDWVGQKDGYGQWGPAFGWMLSTASLFFVLFNLIIVLLKVKEEGLQ